MHKILLAPALALLLLPAAQSARADCAYDLGQARARLQVETDKVRAAAVKKLLDRAAAERRVAETACRDDVTRAWRLLKAPPEPENATKGAANRMRGRNGLPYQ